MKFKKIYALVILSAVTLVLFGCDRECIRSRNCSLEPESGNCYAAFRKYYFDQQEGECKMFIWGGCGGTVPFHTLQECEECLCHE